MKEPVDFVCNFKGCGKRFTKKSRLELHKNLHSEQKPLKCDFEGCSASYSWPQHLRRHVAKTHSQKEKEHKCVLENCTASFDTAFALSQHVRRYHKKSSVNYWCLSCEQQFDMEWKLKEHEGSHTKSEPFECETCHEKFMAYGSYKSHTKIAHKIDKPVFRCLICFRKFETQQDLDVHNHDKHDRNLTCKTCGVTLKTKNGLRKHENIVHLENPTMYSCDHDGCDRSYIHEKNLRQHKRIVHEGQGFQCNICDRFLSSKQKLKLHLEYHEKLQDDESEKEPRKLRPTNVKAGLLRRVPDKDQVNLDLPKKRKPVLKNHHLNLVLTAKKKYCIEGED